MSKLNQLEVRIKWLFILNGILFALPTGMLPARAMPTNAAGTGVGNQVGVYANMVWSFYLAFATALAAAPFQRARKPSLICVPFQIVGPLFPSRR